MTIHTAPKPLPRTDYPSPRDAEARAAYAAGLHHLADVIAATPDCPYPSGPIALFIRGDANPAAVAARLRAALGGGLWEKKESGGYLTLDGMCGGVPVDLWLDRDTVCERVVVGTETIEVPAQAAVEARTETREIVEWVCSPLLAAADETPAAVTA